MQKYIFRGDRSGVFYGELGEQNGQTVQIKNARKLWYWEGACAVEQLAYEGTKNPNSCKFTIAVKEIEIYDLIQRIPCTDEAIQSIEAVKEWKR